MADVNTQAIEAQLKADPAVQQAVQTWIASYNSGIRPHGVSPYENAAKQAAAKHIPDGYHAVVNRDGSIQVEKDSRIPALITAGAIGVMGAGVLSGLAAAGGGASGSLGGGAGAAATLPATSTVGLGTLPTVTGLAGSGAAAAGAGAGTGATVAGSGGVLGALRQIAPVTRVLGAAAQNAQAGRRDDAELQALLDSRNNLARIQTAEYNRDLPSTQAKQVAQGDLMSSPNFRVGHTGSGRDLAFSGGLPEMFGDATTQAGDALKRQSLGRLLSGEDRLAPDISTIPDPSWYERAGAGAGLTGTLLGALDTVTRSPHASPTTLGTGTSLAGNLRGAGELDPLALPTPPPVPGVDDEYLRSPFG